MPATPNGSVSALSSMAFLFIGTVSGPFRVKIHGVPSLGSVTKFTRFQAFPSGLNWLASEDFTAGKPRAEKKSKETVMTPEVTKLMKYSVEDVALEGQAE